MLELKDVLHHHLGCIIQTPEGLGKFIAMYTQGDMPVVCDNTVQSDWEVKDVKAVLWPLDRVNYADLVELSICMHPGYMTIERELPPRNRYLVNNGKGDVAVVDLSRLFSQQTAYLLKRHYDVFGLIERGFAVDVTTLPGNPYEQPANQPETKDWERERGMPVQERTCTGLQYGDSCLMRPAEKDLLMELVANYKMEGISAVAVNGAVELMYRVFYGDYHNEISYASFCERLDEMLSTFDEDGTAPRMEAESPQA